MGYLRTAAEGLTEMDGGLVMFIGWCAVALASVASLAVPEGRFVEAFLMFVGMCAIVATSLACVGAGLLLACRYFVRATKEVRANVDLHQAICEWKQRHPEGSRRYPDPDAD